jgi:hypothetical protein
MTRMRITGFLTFLAFFLWIVPLGVFIRPSQERTSLTASALFPVFQDFAGCIRNSTSPGRPAVGLRGERALW